MSRAQRARRLGKWFLLADNLLVVVGFFMVFPLIGIHYVDGLGWAASMVGLSLAVRQLTQQGLGIIGGALSDRFGAKPFIVGGMLLRAAGMGVMSAADSPWLLLVSCVFMGLGGALFDAPRAGLVVKLTRAHERGRFFALLMMQDSAGAVGGALFGAWLIRFDFQWVAMAGAACFVLCGILNAWLLPAYRITTHKAELTHGVFRVLRDRRFVYYSLTLAGYYLLTVQIFLLLPIAVKQLIGQPEAVGWMYTLDTAISLILLYPLAHWCEGRIRHETRLMAGITLMSLGVLSVGLASNAAALWPALGVYYIGVVLTAPAQEALTAHMADPKARGAYLGFSRFGLGLGGAVGHFGGGWLYDQARLANLPMLPWVVLAGLGGITVLSMWKLFRQPRIAPPHVQPA